MAILVRSSLISSSLLSLLTPSPSTPPPCPPSPLCSHKSFGLLVFLKRALSVYLSSLSSDWWGCDCSSLIWSVHLLQLERDLQDTQIRLIVGDWESPRVNINSNEKSLDLYLTENNIHIKKRMLLKNENALSDYKIFSFSFISEIQFIIDAWILSSSVHSLTRIQFYLLP